VIKTFVHPDRTSAFEDLVNLPSRRALDVFEYPTQVVLSSESEYQMHMIGHHHSRIEFDGLAVAGNYHFEGFTQGFIGKRLSPYGAEGDEVGSPYDFEVRQTPAAIRTSIRAPWICRLEALMVRIWNGSSSHLLESAD
jgi:hypothetical protein